MARIILNILNWLRVIFTGKVHIGRHRFYDPDSPSGEGCSIWIFSYPITVEQLYQWLEDAHPDIDEYVTDNCILDVAHDVPVWGRKRRDYFWNKLPKEYTGGLTYGGK